MLVHKVRHNYPIPAYYNIQQKGIRHYTFFHFSSPVSITVNDEQYQTQPNACILYEPFQNRYIVNRCASQMNWIHLDSSAGDIIKEFHIPTNSVFYPKNTDFLAPLFRKLEVECFSKPLYSERLIRSYLEEFFIRLHRSLYCGETELVINSKEQDKLYYVRGTVLSHLDKRWTVEEMAKLASLSPSRFHTVYKALFNTTPVRDLVEARIDHAKTLLLADDYVSIQDVTDKLGYKSQYYFINQFKAITGCSPGAYRNKNL